MLTWICKRLAYDMTFSSVGDAVSTFFHYYANFDWENDIVFDAFYYKNLPHNKRWSYQRSKQEPMVLLGYHMPRINHAHTTSVPSLKVLVKEFKKADLTLADPSMTWGKFFNSSGDSRTGVTEFLSSYESYVRVSIHYWGRSLPKGRGLVDWVKSKCKSLVNGTLAFSQ